VYRGVEETEPVTEEPETEELDCKSAASMARSTGYCEEETAGRGGTFWRAEFTKVTPLNSRVDLRCFTLV